MIEDCREAPILTPGATVSGAVVVNPTVGADVGAATLAFAISRRFEPVLLATRRIFPLD